MVSTLLILLVAWAVTVPVVLGLGRLLGSWSGSHTEESLRRQAAAGEALARQSAKPIGNVVPLVPRPQNTLVPMPVEQLRQAS